MGPCIRHFTCPNAGTCEILSMSVLYDYSVIGSSECHPGNRLLKSPKFHTNCIFHPTIALCHFTCLHTEIFELLSMYLLHYSSIIVYPQYFQSLRVPTRLLFQSHLSFHLGLCIRAFKCPNKAISKVLCVSMFHQCCKMFSSQSHEICGFMNLL